MKVPKDFPVQPLRPDQPAKDRVTCGTCGRSWDDAIPTAWTPAPSGRCPFEYFHSSVRKNPIGKHRTTIGGSGPAGMTCVKYHATNVVCFNDREIILDSGGWKTATTKKRINQAADEFGFGFSVVQRQGTWWVQFYDGRAAKHFEDGMRIARVQKNPIKERIAAARHARAIRRTPGGRQLARSVIAYGRGRGLLTKNPTRRSRVEFYTPGSDADPRGWRNSAGELQDPIFTYRAGTILKPHPGTVGPTFKFTSEGAQQMKKNPHRRTSKKRLSPKQAAWRKEFARRVKAGLFKKSAARTRRGFTFHKNPKPRKISRRALRVSIKKAWNRGLKDVAHYPKNIYLKDATDFGRRKRVPFKENPVRSKLLCVKNRAGKWWYLKNAGSALHGPELTDDKSKARRFATDAAAMSVATRIKSLLAANGFVTAETR